MNKLFYPLLLIFFISCSSGDVTIPSDVIQKDTMVQVLTDVQIAEASLMFQNSRGMSTVGKAPRYYQFIFKKHHINEKQFRKSFSFYMDQPELMDKMYGEVINEISKRQAEVSNK
jgi:hypothetical protein